MDYASQKVFTDFSLMRLLSTGCGMDLDNDIRSMIKILYGEKQLLGRKNQIKCFALSAACDDIECNKDKLPDKKITYDSTVEPYLLRSYVHPAEEDDKPIEEEDHIHTYQNGTSQIKVWEAMAATSAIPGAFDRVKVNVNGKSKVLADGSVCCNCPISVALKEAQSIWPNRPIGVVLSFGIDSSQDDYAQAAIDSVRLNHPGLHYERIKIPEVQKYFCLETDKERIREMEELVQGFMSSDEMRARMTTLLKKLHGQEV